MRVSQSMLSDTTLFNLSNNMEHLLSIQEMLSTGKQITRPSDGPIAFSQALGYRSAIEANNQNSKNADDAITWLNTSDNALKEAGDVLQRVRELTVRASSDTLAASDRVAIANEVDQLYKQMRAIGNSDLGGRYIFAGTDQTNQPYPDSGVDPNNTGLISLEMGNAITVQYNTLGVDAFGRTAVGPKGEPIDPSNVFVVMQNLSTALKANDQAGISAALPLIDQRQQAFLTAQSVIGGKTNRLDLIKSRLDDQNTNLAQLQSQTEDADMSQLVTDLNQQDSVYRASLAAGSRVIQPTLLDFLR